MAGENTHRSRFPRLGMASRVLLGSLAVIHVATGAAVPPITGDVAFSGPGKGQLHGGAANGTSRDLWGGPGEPPRCRAGGGRSVGLPEFLGVLGDRLSDKSSPVRAADFQLWVADAVGCDEDLLRDMLVKLEGVLHAVMLKLKLGEERKALSHKQQQQQQHQKKEEEGPDPDIETPWPTWVPRPGGPAGGSDSDAGPGVAMDYPVLVPGDNPALQAPSDDDLDQRGEAAGQDEGGRAATASKRARVARANNWDPIMGLAPAPTPVEQDEAAEVEEDDRRVMRLYDPHGAWVCTRLE